MAGAGQVESHRSEVKNEVNEMKATAISADGVRKLEVAPVLPAREEIPAHIKWLIDHYVPPPMLVDDLGRPPVQGERRRSVGSLAKLMPEETTSPSVEHAAALYRMRERQETFIEWLWANYPPVADRE
jgi:hypothetical protein